MFMIVIFLDGIFCGEVVVICVVDDFEGMVVVVDVMLFYLVDYIWFD